MGAIELLLIIAAPISLVVSAFAYLGYREYKRHIEKQWREKDEDTEK